MFADHYLPVDADLVPDGGPAPVAGTPFDLTAPTLIGDRLDDPALRPTSGYDHCFVLRGDGLRAAAQVRDPGSGRTLTVLTDQPGLQFYTGNLLDTTAHDGRRVGRHGALCLEPQ